MIDKVIYINYQAITKKYYYDYYLKDCIDNGLDVEYWDVSKWFYPSLEFHSDVDFSNINYIKSNSELKRLLSTKNINSTFFITNINFNFKVLRLFITLSSFKCTLAFFGRGMLPDAPQKYKSKVIKALLSLNFKKLINPLKNKSTILFKKYKIVKPLDFLFQAGSEGAKGVGFGSFYDLKYATIININYFDYDKFLSVNQNEVLVENKYCVFMDQYLAHHPDIPMSGLKNVNAEIYYSDLNSFFGNIEKKYNLKVVIAAHPKATKYLTHNPFEGRKIIFEKTCELVKDSTFVLTHHSTAISFPILFEKPIIFINSQVLLDAMPGLYDLTIFFAKYLNSELVDLDNFDENKDFNLVIDKEIYTSYKYKFLSSEGSEGKLTSQIFIETLFSL